MEPATAALIAAGIQTVGNYMGAQHQSSAVRDTNEATLAQNREMVDRSERLQREFANNGISWKVEDAKRAGIHPLAALGAQTHSASPVGVGVGLQPDYSQADFAKNLGQDVSRAFLATQDSHTRELNRLQLASAELDLEGRALDNQIKASQLRKISGPQIGPSLPSPTDSPIPGQGDSGFKVKPAEATASSRINPAQQAGAINDYGFVRTPRGYAVVPSTDVKERIEDQFVPETMWAVRNSLLPMISGHPAPDPRNYPIPEHLKKYGADSWKWSTFHQEFRPYNSKRKYLIPSYLMDKK